MTLKITCFRLNILAIIYSACFTSVINYLTSQFKYNPNNTKFSQAFYLEIGSVGDTEHILVGKNSNLALFMSVKFTIKGKKGLNLFTISQESLKPKVKGWSDTLCVLTPQLTAKQVGKIWSDKGTKKNGMALQENDNFLVKILPSDRYITVS